MNFKEKITDGIWTAIHHSLLEYLTWHTTTAYCSRKLELFQATGILSERFKGISELELNRIINNLQSELMTRLEYELLDCLYHAPVKGTTDSEHFKSVLTHTIEMLKGLDSQGVAVLVSDKLLQPVLDCNLPSDVVLGRATFEPNSPNENTCCVFTKSAIVATFEEEPIVSSVKNIKTDEEFVRVVLKYVIETAPHMVNLIELKG